MTYTDNLNLNKPDLDDFYNIDDMNENMEIIDDMGGDVAQLKIDITKAELTGKELTTQEYEEGIEAGTITDHDDIDYYLTDYENVPTNSYMINHHDSTVGETLDAHSDEIAKLEIKSQTISGANFIRIGSIVALSGYVTLPITIPNVYQPTQPIFVPCNHNGKVDYALINGNSISVGDGGTKTGNVFVTATYIGKNTT